MVLDEEARTLNEVVRKQEHLITVLREELNNSTARMRLKEEQEAMRGWKRWQALQRRMDCHTPGIRRSAPPTEDELWCSFWTAITGVVVGAKVLAVIHP